MQSFLAKEYGDMLGRSSSPLTEVRAALRGQERVIGPIWIDGDHLGIDGAAHLWCFVVDDSVRGPGVGNRLMEAAMAFARQVGFREVRLRTIKELWTA